MFLPQQISTFNWILRHRRKELGAIYTSILNIALPILYFAVVWTYGKSFFSDAPWAKQSKSWLLLITLVLHALYLVTRTYAFAHPPVTTIYEILSVLSLAVATSYAVIEQRSRAKETGYFILNLAFFFQLASSVFIRDDLEVPEIMKSLWFGMHIANALCAYAAITISAAYGFLYLMLYHEIKAHRFGVIYKKLPNLETLERMNFIAIILAFLFLSLAILAGVIWLPQAFPGHSYADPKLIGTVFLWLLYGIGIVTKLRGGLRGRLLMVLSICAFGVALFSMSVINIFFSDFHKFN